MAKKTKGRQKIPMAKIENESNLQVTFSKRRTGLFKKASDLCILCGVEIAIVVFSPSKKPFCFGHPSVEMIADRFLLQQHDLISTPQQQLMQAHRNGRISELINTQLTYGESQLEAAKNKSEELAKISKERMNNPLWCDAPIEGMELQELEKLKLAMRLLKGDIDERKKKITANPLQIAGPSNSGSVHGGDVIANGSGLELRMTPHGLELGYRHSDP